MWLAPRWGRANQILQIEWSLKGFLVKRSKTWNGESVFVVKAARYDTNTLCPLSGLLPFQIPYVEFSGQDYSNSHDAVGLTPPPQSLTSGDTWYKWYGEITPDENEVAKVKKTYKAYLKWRRPVDRTAMLLPLIK